MEKVRLTEVCDFQGGAQPPKEEWSFEQKDGYIRMLQIRDFTQTRNVEKEYVNLTASTKTCESDDILIARYGASVGKILTGLSGAYNVAIMKTIPNEKVLRKPYLKYYLLSDYFQNRINNVGERAAQAGFNKEDLSKLYIPLIFLKEQDRISYLLDKITDLINKRKKQLEKLDELVKARFVELFGDPVQNPMGWKTDYLKNATSKIGSGATPKGGKESYQDEGITLIRSMNVHDGRFEYKDLAHITDEQAKQLDNVTIEENDVFINITGASVARSCIVPRHILPARVNQHVAIIRCISSMLNPIFANNMFLNHGFKGQLLDIGETGGATRQAITKQQLESLSVILPPIELQEQFAAFVEHTDKSKMEVQKSLEKLELLKKVLMQKYFG